MQALHVAMEKQRFRVQEYTLEQYKSTWSSRSFQYPEQTSQKHN